MNTVLTYTVTSTEIDGTRRYGVAAEEDGVVIDSVADISLKRSEAELFADRCRRLSLSRIHFREAAEDFAAEISQ